jgi:YggT family protein
MKNILFLITNTVSAYISILTFLLFIRAFMSFFIQETNSKPVLFIYSVTEPVIYPVRSALMKIEFFQTLPIDFSIMITLFLLSFLRMFLI